MKQTTLSRLRQRLFIKYIAIIIGIILAGIGIIYIFDDVLNGIVIDFIRLFMITGDPFELFDRIYRIAFPILIVLGIIVLIYFLCRDLVNYMRILMRGVDDVMRRNHNRVDFPKEMKEAEDCIIAISDTYQNYMKSVIEDEEKKKDLVYLLAQDIKMPLSNILMYLELLHKEKRISSEIQKDFIVKVLHKSMDLEDMINEFFDITRFNLQYAKWNPEFMYLDRMMAQVVDEYYMIVEEKAMNVEIHGGNQLPLYADNDKIARVIRDLLHNLVELGKAKETIYIYMDEKEASYNIRMQVESIHLSAYQIAHIFHNYYRMEDIHGNGKMHVMGLGIAKQIMDMQKGTLRASSIDTTLTFYVEIPRTVMNPQEKYEKKE